MPVKKLKLSVIVLLYRGDRWIEGCVHSLQNQSLDSNLYEIILVDNGGSTPSVHKFQEWKNIKVVSFPKNYGFAEGNNQALSFADGDIILLMNQDVMVHFRCLEEILKYLLLFELGLRELVQVLQLNTLNVLKRGLFMFLD